MIYRTTDIHGLGPVQQGKLASVSILNSAHLMTHCGSRSGREEIRRRTGIPEEELRSWTIQAELMRIPSVGPGEAYLLERCGVKNFEDLQHHDAHHLLTAITAANDRERILDVLPSEERVKSWIADSEILSPLLIS